MFISKKKYHLEDSMQSLIKTAQFQDKFEVPRFDQQDQSLQFAVLDLIAISEDLDKLGSQQLSKQILKVAHDIMGDEESEMEEMPHDYETCETCGYDHSYDIDYPGVREEIEVAHAGPDIEYYDDFGSADDSGKSKIEKEICKHLEKIDEEMKECEHAISTFDYKEDDEKSKKDLGKLQKAFNKMNDQKNKMLDILEQFEERKKEKSDSKENESKESDDSEELK